MLPISENDLRGLKENDVESLAMLDSNGILMAPGETLDEFKKRITELLKHLGEIDEDLKKKHRVDLFDDLPLLADDLIPQHIMQEATTKTRQLYSFGIDWVPGFFLSKSLGLLWGGCAISFPEISLSIFLIRSSFRRMKRWFIYDREELLAHELCHVARMPLRDRNFEEYFAYQTSNSKLRKYLGNCFQSTHDAILFVLPVLILLAAQLVLSFTTLRYPIWPFWIAALAYPCWLLVRNHHYRRVYQKAEENLKKTGLKEPAHVLFRCSKAEILTISRKNSPEDLSNWLQEQRQQELRWRVYHYRFIPH